VRVSELVIGASNIVSPLCYTVLRLEPYSACPFGCAYCYSRWYTRGDSGGLYPRYGVVGAFRDLARRVRRRGLRPVSLRLATLVDPFPPNEHIHGVAERLLSVALELEYPLVVNTKGTHYRSGRVARKLEALLDRGLAVLQVSLATLDPSKARVLEPLAPPPAERLRAVRELGPTGAPLVLRVSPFIPYVSPTEPEEVREFASLCRELGVRHVIAESLRVERERFGGVLEALGVRGVKLEGYSLREVDGAKPVVRVSRTTLLPVYRLYSEALHQVGATFATCKEGLLDLHTAPDCCGVYLLREGAVRYTLYDLYRYAAEGSAKIPLPLDYAVVREVCRRFSRLYLEELAAYPRVISKGLRYHERKLLKVLHSVEILKHVAPAMLKILDLGSSR